MPIACLASAGWATTSTPPTTALPSVGITIEVSMPTVVVFPAPFGPSRPKISPRRSDRSRWSTAFTPPGKTFVRPSVRMTSSSAVSAATCDMRAPPFSLAGAVIGRDVCVQLLECPGQNLQLAGGELCSQLGVGCAHHERELLEPPPPGGRHRDPDHAPVAVVAAAGDEPGALQTIEVPDHGRRLDAHPARQLTLADAVGGFGTLQRLEHDPVGDARFVGRERAICPLVHHLVRESDAATQELVVLRLDHDQKTLAR